MLSVRLPAASVAKSVVHSLAASVLVTLAAVSLPAQAETNAQLGLVTEYVRDGISETRGNFAAQGGINYAHNSGVYGGVWASQLQRKDDDSHSEWDFYSGISRSLTSELGVDAGFTRYTFQGDSSRDEDNLNHYNEVHARVFYDQSLVLGWRHTNHYIGSRFARRVLEASYTLHSSDFDFEFYGAQHRLLGLDDDYNFGDDDRDSYWHFRVGVERTYNQWDYRLTLERTNLTSDFDAGTTFQFGIHRYFDF